MNRDGRKSPPISPSRASIGSDGGTLSLRSPTAAALPAVKPAPAYISQAAASDFVTSYQRERLEHREVDDPPEPRELTDAFFAETGLALVNGFIDHLLYQFLATARSTSLPALRPAVEQILKAKLARQAFANADEELHDLLGDDEDIEDDDSSSVQSSEEFRGKWDLDAVWKMTRLKVMVYTSTSDLDDDEEEQLSSEHMTASQHRQSRNFGLVSWTTSIFLTSILEFIGEQCLAIAGQAAYDRSSVKRKSKLSSPETPDGQGVIVDEFDVERIALNASLGRLWRTWRKSLRSTRSFIASSPNSSRRPSIITNHSPQASKSGDDTKRESQIDPAMMAEPIQEQDMEERRERNAKAFEEMQNKSEVSDEQNLDRPQLNRTRSRSFGALPLPTGTPSVEDDTIEEPIRPSMLRKRSNSQPNPLRSNPPDVFYEAEEPVPDVPKAEEKETEDQITDTDEHAEKENKHGEADLHRSRSVTPFEGESENMADPERPNTTVSDYTKASIPEDATETATEHAEEPVSEQHTTDQTMPATVTNDPTQTMKTSKQRPLEQQEEVEEDMEATEAAAALNSLPPNLAKREIPVDVALASAVPGAFPAMPSAPSSTEPRYEPPAQLHTVEEDQELHNETPDSPKQAMLDVKDISRADKTSTTAVTFPSNPSSIYDDAPQDRQSLEMSEEPPATPPKDHQNRDSAQLGSPAPSKTPAYTGTTVTILSNSADARDKYSAPKITTPPPAPSHMKTSSQISDFESPARTGRSAKPVITASIEDNEAMERNFEGLMASSQTKKYTLTPQNLRAIETDPNSPGGTSTAQPVVRTKSGQKFNVMAVNERQDEASAPPPPQKKLGPSWSVKYGKLNQNNNRPSKAGLLAREPRAQNESMREFAEFIRSTAPDSRPGPGGHTVPILLSSNNPNPAASAAIAASAKSSRPSLENGGGKQNPRFTASPSVSSNASRNHMSNSSARAASTPRSNVNADLIDFLNSGPPRAPSTPGMSNSRANGRNGTRSYDNLKAGNSSVDNRAGSTMTPSVHDSFNSHRPLVQPPGGAPVRKQHRVKDPYALPSDDEDEEEDEFPMPPRKPQGGNQESLIDFLNNYDPPGTRQDPPPVSAKAQKMLGGNARALKAAPPIAPHGSNDSSQISLDASALPEFLRSEPQKANNYPDSYTTTTIESLSSQKSKSKKGFWRKASS